MYCCADAHLREETWSLFSVQEVVDQSNESHGWAWHIVIRMPPLPPKRCHMIVCRDVDGECRLWRGCFNPGHQFRRLSVSACLSSCRRSYHFIVSLSKNLQRAFGNHCMNEWAMKEREVRIEIKRLTALPNPGYGSAPSVPTSRKTLTYFFKCANQVIQFVTFSPPSWRSPATTEKGHLTIPQRSQRIARKVKKLIGLSNKWVGEH